MNELRCLRFSYLLRIAVNSFILSRLFRNKISVAALSVLFLVSGIQAQDAGPGEGEWARFRGPNGSGIAAGAAKSIPVEFTVADYKWRTKLPGGGHSSPVVWGEHIYVTVDEGSGERSVVCYHLDDGRELWKLPARFEEHNLNKFNNFASSTPACDETGVYVTWGSGMSSVALGVDHSGKLLWQRDWDAFTSDHGAAASPIVVDGIVILNTDSRDEGRNLIHALDAKTGAELWTHERVSAEGEKHITPYNTPVVLELGGKKTVAFFSTNDGWLGLEAATGREVWRHGGEYKYRSVSSLVTGDGILFGTMGSGGAGKDSTGLKFESGVVQPKLAYALGIRDNLSYVPTPLIYNGLTFLWGDGGIVNCIDAATGEQAYDKPKRIGGNFFSSPICIDGKIYCGSREGEMVVIPATRDFKILGRSQFDSGIFATPAVAGGRLIVRTETHLISIGGE